MMNIPHRIGTTGTGGKGTGTGKGTGGKGTGGTGTTGKGTTEKGTTEKGIGGGGLIKNTRRSKTNTPYSSKDTTRSTRSAKIKTIQLGLATKTNSMNSKINNSKMNDSKINNSKTMNSKMNDSKINNLKTMNSKINNSKTMNSKTKTNDSKTMNSKQQREIAARKIARVVDSTLHNRYKLQSRFLKSVCSRAGVCMMFGHESDKIKEFFDNFTDFKYASGNVKRIGSVSANGFVNEITYERDGYKSFAVLKSTLDAVSDNLYYEYLVGKFVNEYAQILPCFVETYGIFKYKTQQVHNILKKNTINPTSILTNGLENISDLVDNDPLTDPIELSCEHPVKLAVLTQHFDNVISLGDFVKTKGADEKSFLVDLPCLLYQVYSALSNMANVFTHNDLHYDNILVYEPFPDGYIEFRYHYKNGGVVAFNSPYISKLIDYGRCWFKYNDASKITPVKVHEQVCNTRACASPGVSPSLLASDPASYDCGENVGYGWLTPFRDQENYFISSMYRNNSNDLRALRTLSSIPNKFMDNSKSAKLMHLVLGSTIIPEFGVAEKTTSGLNFVPKKINNVIDAANIFSSILKEPSFAAKNEYPNRTKRGVLHIFLGDKTVPMEFLPTSFTTLFKL